MVVGYSPGEYVAITLPDGRQVRPTSDLKYSTSGTDYFLYCVSMDWDPHLFDDFSGTDCCVVIKNPDEFARRLERAAVNHLMENASRAFLDAVRKSMRQIRTVIGSTTIDPKLLTAAERLQYEGYFRREETNAAILALSTNGIPIKQIVRQTGRSRKLVRQVIRGERTDVLRTRQSSLDPHLPWLDDQWASGCRNGAELWRRLKARGFRGSLRVISEWATRRRRAERADTQNLRRTPSARIIVRLMTVSRDLLTKAETVTVAAIEAGVPPLVEAREIIAEFHLTIRRKTEAGLIPWIERARASLVRQRRRQGRSGDPSSNSFALV
jgi:transposase